MWTAIPALLIPIAFGVVLMGIIKIWMVSAPVKRRPFPRYSLHVMQEIPPDKPGHATASASSYARSKPQYPPPKGRPQSTFVLPFARPGDTQNMIRSGTNTPGGASLYSVGARSTNQPRQWQGKFL